MSNRECADLYERIIEEVIQESRQDFEDSGIDEQTLLDLRKIWKDRLSKTKVANFSWDVQNNDSSDDDEPLATLAQRGQNMSHDLMNSQQFTNEMTGNGNDLGVHGLHLPQSDLALPNTLPKQEDENNHGGIVLPGGTTIGQTDGTIEFEIEVDSRSKLAKQLRKKAKKRSKKVINNQVDGPYDSDSDDDNEDLGSDLGVDSDEINSDLDDPDDDDINDDEDNDDPETNIMLCLYDRVQRVKNKWKCSLKDGIANIEGKDYTFQKATGDSEW